MAKATSNRREFLQLAEPFKPEKKDRKGQCSFRGRRPVHFREARRHPLLLGWRLSRGVPTIEVPWASVTDPKTGKLKGKIKPIATGLWSRYGNPIMAPDWFLNWLPCCPADGELWAGRGNFQLCRSICGGDEPDPRFKKIAYAVYSCPPLGRSFRRRRDQNTNMVVTTSYVKIMAWMKQRMEEFEGDFRFLNPGADLRRRVEVSAGGHRTQNDHCFMHRQVLPARRRDRCPRTDGIAHGQDARRGGEGVVLRDPRRLGFQRHTGILKFKPYSDAEARVIGFTMGRETAQGQPAARHDRGPDRGLQRQAAGTLPA